MFTRGEAELISDNEAKESNKGLFMETIQSPEDKKFCKSTKHLMHAFSTPVQQLESDDR